MPPETGQNGYSKAQEIPTNRSVHCSTSNGSILTIFASYTFVDDPNVDAVNFIYQELGGPIASGMKRQLVDECLLEDTEYIVDTLYLGPMIAYPFGLTQTESSLPDRRIAALPKGAPQLEPWRAEKVPRARHLPLHHALKRGNGESGVWS